MARTGEWTLALLTWLASMGLRSRARQNATGQISKYVFPDGHVFGADKLLSQVGSLLYARVSLAHKDMEPELECFDAQTRKAEGFGELKGGFMVKCSLKMCRQ